MVVVVACAPAVQVQRLMARDGVSAEAARRGWRAQWPIEDKARLADRVIALTAAWRTRRARPSDSLDSLRSSDQRLTTFGRGALRAP